MDEEKELVSCITGGKFNCFDQVYIPRLMAEGTIRGWQCRCVNGKNFDYVYTVSIQAPLYLSGRGGRFEEAELESLRRRR